MIHKTSIIDKKAKISRNVTVGPYSIIEADVDINDNTVIGNHVTISRNTRIGKDCKIFHSASIGEVPQDLKYNDEKTVAEIGDRTVIREFVTINKGTSASGKTIVGSDCLLMACVHIAHDCIIKSNVILANNATLAGHVEIDHNAILGGNSAIHQFVRIGKYAMIGGMSGVEKDIIPYGLYTGIRENLKSLNLIGLKRKGLTSNAINEIKNLINIIFDKNDTIENNIKNNFVESSEILEIKEVIEFLNSNSKRGITTFEND